MTIEDRLVGDREYAPKSSDLREAALEILADEAEFEKLLEKTRADLLGAQVIEQLMYEEAPDPVVEIFREDLLENRFDGSPRPQCERDQLRRAWKIARENFLPAMSYFESTASSQVRPTEWIEIFGEKGAHKTTLGIYYVHWYLDRCPWIAAVFSTIPIYAYSLDYPFVLRDDEGKRILHPKYKVIKTLREIGDYENALVFLDEIANLMPGRNFSDRSQWLITTWTRNFRKRNVMLIATTQRETSPDPEMRQNFSPLIRPEVVDGKLTWLVWKNDDSEYSIYKRWKAGDRSEEVQPTQYPTEGLDINYPEPSLPWLYAAFDSRLEVPILFQEPLEKSRVESEAMAFKSWIDLADSGGINSNYYSRGEVPPEGELKKALDAWNVTEKKMYDSDEMLLIGQDFKRLFHKKSEPEIPAAEPAKDKPPVEIYNCECGYQTVSETDLVSHRATVKNSVLGLVRASREKVENLRRTHPELLK